MVFKDLSFYFHSQIHGQEKSFAVYIDKCFGTPSILNASFLDSKTRLDCNFYQSGLDLVAVHRAYEYLISLVIPIFSTIKSFQHKPSLLELISQLLARSLSKIKTSTVTNPEMLRMILIIFENPILTVISRITLPLLERLIQFITSLSQQMKDILFSWFIHMLIVLNYFFRWSNFPSENYSRTVKTLSNFVSYLAKVYFSYKNIT